MKLKTVIAGVALSVAMVSPAFAWNNADVYQMQQAINNEYNNYYQQYGQVIPPTAENFSILMARIGAPAEFGAWVWQVLQNTYAAANQPEVSGPFQASAQTEQTQDTNRLIRQFLMNRLQQSHLDSLEDQAHKTKIEGMREHNKVWLEGFKNAYQ